ncbi:MAG TPA: copper-translocating P-type ATPase [Frankiaceae bacterium]|nr:copper-translocating P-type ATPase [Frankiaceae bacterium]
MTTTHSSHGSSDTPGGHDGHAVHDAHGSGHACHAGGDHGDGHVPAGHDAGHDQHAGHDKHAGHDQHGAHDKHAGHDPEAFRRRFWLSLLLTLPVVATSHMVMGWFGYDLDFPGIRWVGPVLGTAVLGYGGRPFLTGAVAELRDRRPGMMLLVSLALAVAFGASAANALGAFALEFWWELAALVTIMLLGHWQEMKALGQTRDALGALAALLPDEADRVGADGEVTTVPATALNAGDVVLVRAGARVPADGEVVAGVAEVDESAVTGESRPVTRTTGDRVVAGTVSTDSAIRVRVTAVGDGTALAGIQRLVAAAQQSRSRAQALADRAAALLVYVALLAAVVTFTSWSLAGDVRRAVVLTVGVLVISCPHALGLAIPLVVSLSSSVAARAGILVKDRLALERMRTVDAVLFDKTGTLTKGAHVVTAVAGDADALAIAGAVEADSEHPLARAIVAAARERGAVPAAREFTSRPGRGVEAEVGGVRYAVGGPALLRERGLAEPPDLAATTDGWRARGAAVLYLLDADLVRGAFALEDEIRPEAKQAVADLHALGRRVILVTGDAREVAQAVAAELGVDEVLAEVLPEQKEEAVAALQARGLTVAMVGDGVNDAPALARADVGIAIGAGTDVAVESAGVVLASNDPRAVVSVIRLSRAGYRKMVQNLAWAAGYNVLAIPLAAGAFAWAGLTLSPAVGAVLMSASTIMVALNAQLLRRLDLRPTENGSAR